MNVIIDGKEYAPVVTGDDVRIVALQRGWVAVGHYSKAGDLCTLNHAAIIRVWGTTGGLPEIADNGPTPKTILEKCSGVITFHQLTEIFSLTCNAEQWIGKI